MSCQDCHQVIDSEVALLASWRWSTLRQSRTPCHCLGCRLSSEPLRQRLGFQHVYIDLDDAGRTAWLAVAIVHIPDLALNGNRLVDRIREVLECLRLAGNRQLGKGNITISSGNIDDTIALDLVQDRKGGLKHSVADKPVFDLDYACKIGVYCQNLRLIDLGHFAPHRAASSLVPEGPARPFSPSPCAGSRLCSPDALVPGPVVSLGVGGDVLAADTLARKIPAVKFCDLADREPSRMLGSDPFPIFLKSPGHDFVLPFNTLSAQDCAGKHILGIVIAMKTRKGDQKFITG